MWAEELQLPPPLAGVSQASTESPRPSGLRGETSLNTASTVYRKPGITPEQILSHSIPLTPSTSCCTVRLAAANACACMDQFDSTLALIAWHCRMLMKCGRLRKLNSKGIYNRGLVARKNKKGLLLATLRLSDRGKVKMKQKKATRKQLCLSALGKWGRTKMGSDGFNRILLSDLSGYALHL